MRGRCENCKEMKWVRRIHINGVPGIVMCLCKKCRDFLASQYLSEKKLVPERRRFVKSNKSKVGRMFELRDKGWSYSAIARNLNVHHTTVMYWLGALRNRKPVKKSKCKKVADNLRERLERDDGINKGKTYVEYLEESRQNENRNRKL